MEIFLATVLLPAQLNGYSTRELHQEILNSGMVFSTLERAQAAAQELYEEQFEEVNDEVEEEGSLDYWVPEKLEFEQESDGVWKCSQEFPWSKDPEHSFHFRIRRQIVEG